MRLDSGVPLAVSVTAFCFWRAIPSRPNLFGMRIAVTGGTGFLGRAFVREAIARGHDLLLLVRREVPRETWQVPARTFSRIHLASGAVESPDWAAIEAFRPESCLHAAWISTPGVYLQSPENEMHLRWSRSFLARIATSGGCSILGIGTCAEYAPASGVLNEVTSQPQPVSPYARAKDELRRWLQESLPANGAPAAWARIFYPYGVGEHRDRVCSHILRELSSGRPVRLKTPNSVRDYIHVTDVARALLTILETRYSGVINVGTGKGVQIGELARTLGRLVDREDLVELPGAAVAQSADCVVADIQRLTGLGWKAEVPLESGLQGLIEQPPS